MRSACWGTAPALTARTPEDDLMFVELRAEIERVMVTLPQKCREVFRMSPASKGIPYADYYAVLVDAQKGLKQEYQKDSIHPNAAGYLAMEGVIQPILERILK